MIASLEGTILSAADDHLVVGVSGVGFKVFVTSSLKSARVGDVVRLQTHLVVREDLLALYGFETTSEREFFLLLLGVNGVGPRIAMAILSTLSVDAIRRAVLSEQVDMFARVPGVGKKTAQKIMLHLQGKVSGGDVVGEILHITDVDAEVLDALTSLGYSVVEAQAALQAIPREAPKDVESRLRYALQYFSS